MSLVGISEIAERYGVSPQLVNRWASTQLFPSPVAALKQGRVWSCRHVDGWVVENRPEYANPRRVDRRRRAKR